MHPLVHAKYFANYGKSYICLEFYVRNVLQTCFDPYSISLINCLG
jgi:hypothetical protein